MNLNEEKSIAETKRNRYVLYDSQMNFFSYRLLFRNILAHSLIMYGMLYANCIEFFVLWSYINTLALSLHQMIVLVPSHRPFDIFFFIHFSCACAMLKICGIHFEFTTKALV